LLVLKRGIPQSRAALAGLFWPDTDEGQARTNLRKLIFELRRLLPRAASLRFGRDTLEWAADSEYDVDVEAFERAAAHAASMDELEIGIALYRGDLLPGCYDEWILAERERLGQVYASLLERLVAALEARRSFRLALAQAGRLLDRDPLREETYRLLMRLHDQEGDRAGVTQAYRRCVATLRQELDVRPSAATEELYARLNGAGAEPPVPVLTNLPTALSRFVGREPEIAEIAPVLARSRLLTLTGAAGCGKTRLALRIAQAGLRAHDDGVWLVELAPLSDPRLVAPAIASVLGVVERPGAEGIGSLAEALREKRLLLVLDNCEHLGEACAAVVVHVTARCPGIRVLASSQHPLGVPGERVWRVSPLTLPDAASPPHDPEAVLRYDAVRLFVDRAEAVRPDFRLGTHNAATVVHICRRLDGLPLAIEFAAALVRGMPLEQIAARLDDGLRLLEGNSRIALPRQQTLLGALHWSYGLLTPLEQTLLRRLAVFAGGWGIEAAETVCAGEAIERDAIAPLLVHLVDKSLVVMDIDSTQGSDARYRLLETVRQYARRALDAKEEAGSLQDRHLDWCVELAERADAAILTSAQARWLRHLEVEHDNLRAALARAGEVRPEAGLRLVGNLWRFWEMRDHLSEGRRWAQRFLASTSGHSAARAKALLAAGNLARDQGNLEEALALHQESHTAYRFLGDRRGEANALNNLGIVAWQLGDHERAGTAFEASRALYRELGDAWGLANSLNNEALVRMSQTRYAIARSVLSEGLTLFQELGETSGMARVLNNLGSLAVREGQYVTARALLEQSLALKRRLGAARSLVVALEEFAALEAFEAHAPRAAHLFGAAEAARQRLGILHPLSDTTYYEGAIATARSLLDADQFAEAWERGRTFTLDEAIEEVLSSSPEPGADSRARLASPK
jgi:non-specific serine/threonine protein kinase